jgi:hypothetical protein
MGRLEMSANALRLRRTWLPKREIIDALNELDAIAESAGIAATQGPLAVLFDVSETTGSEISEATFPEPNQSHE